MEKIHTCTSNAKETPRDSYMIWLKYTKNAQDISGEIKVVLEKFAL